MNRRETLIVREASMNSPFTSVRNTKSCARALTSTALATVLTLLCISAETSSAAVDAATQAASKSLQAKIQILESKDNPPAAPHPAIVITSYEANSYLIVHSGEFLPAGVGTPSITVEPDHLSAAGDVDFDKLSRLYPNPNDMGPKILAAMFHGTQHVTITGNSVSISSGVLLFIESVVVGRTTVPKWLVDYIIQNVLQPKYHFDLSKPFPYPDHVNKIVQGSGQATFLRGPKDGR
jgi:hypothetical protein